MEPPVSIWVRSNTQCNEGLARTSDHVSYFAGTQTGRGGSRGRVRRRLRPREDTRELGYPLSSGNDGSARTLVLYRSSQHLWYCISRAARTYGYIATTLEFAIRR